MQDLDPTQYGEAERGEVDPPVEVQVANARQPARSTAGSENAGNGSVVYAVQMAVNGGSKLLIFVLPAANVDFAVHSNQAQALVAYWLVSSGSHVGRSAIC
jgi:hypothetical protein